MNKISAYFIIIALAILSLAILAAKSPRHGLISLNGKKFIAELALTPRDWKTGLSGRTRLCKHCGMLFVFPEKGNYSFWMKNMSFDLDLISISGNRIIHIEKNVSHESLDLMDPGENCDKVLEINAGLSEKYGFKIGDKIKIYGI